MPVVCDNVKTGPIYKGTGTPMETVFTLAYNGINNGRPSGDQATVLVGARGVSYNGTTYWKEDTTGHLEVNMTGEAESHWEESPDAPNHKLVVVDETTIPDEDMEDILNDLMDPSWVN